MSSNAKDGKKKEDVAAAFFSQAELSPDKKKDNQEEQLKRQAEQVLQSQQVKIERGTAKLP